MTDRQRLYSATLRLWALALRLERRAVLEDAIRGERSPELASLAHDARLRGMELSAWTRTQVAMQQARARR